MAHKVTLLAGESGESTNHVDEVLRVLAATGVRIDWERHELRGHEITEAFVDSALKTRRVLMPWLHGRRHERRPAPIIQARRALNAYVNVRPVSSLPKVGERFQNVDVIVVREVTEDVYTSLEHETIQGIFEGLKVTTEQACERVARHAFELAKNLGRKRVTIVHKSNIMKKSDGLFLRTCQRVAEEYPEITCDERIVDALCMQLTMYPERFDILVCANLFGDIVADLASGLVGAKANCPSMNIGEDDVRIYSVGHGDMLDIANSDAGNPMSLLLSGVRLLQDIGETDAATRLKNGLFQCLESGRLPLALDGEETLVSFCDAVIQAIQQQPERAS